MSFNERLVMFRKKAGLSQQDLADAIHVSIDSIRRWEAKKQEPRLSDLKALAAELKVTVGELTDETPLPEKALNDIHPQPVTKNNKEKVNKIVIRYGHLALELPADDKGYEFLNAKIKGFAIDDNSITSLINTTEES